MKTNILSLLAIAGLLTFAGCANDDTTNKPNEQEPGTEGLTSFVEEDNSTRTTAEYDGSGLNFFWTASDRLWVNNSGTLTQDSKNNINSTLVNNPANSSAVKRAAKANFWFAGTFTNTSYPVRYTGKNGVKDKVTIKAAQSQTVPNDASHIGEDGDCGVAIATKPAGKNGYYFTLDHKAAYATFVPYNSNRVVADFVIQKITIMADQALCGTFDFNDNGIDVSSRPAPTTTNRVIELTLNDFAIPATATPATNAATAVIAPGSYTHFIVIYTLHNPVTNQTGTVTKQYPGTVTFTEGKNKKISQNLPPNYSADSYYMWDAQQYYWYGHLDANGQPDNSNPENSTGMSAPSLVMGYTDATGTAPAVVATHSCKDCPNANECLWYTMHGDPHWDTTELWSTNGHLYTTGMWLKKKDNISGYTAAVAPDGIDYTRSINKITYPKGYNSSVTQNRPTTNALDNYFYLPVLDKYYTGTLYYTPGNSGYYWSSTPYPNRDNVAYMLWLRQSDVTVSGVMRTVGYQLWRAQ